ncbi:helix-turn-helix transcriptional regulator [Alkalibacillus sp. S2W]|uniref:helix-turn-helix transcriptional regulator n=1 Tax=Alkalibacillus sp. S2W TaxID=3386553 RepID=UPI00398D4DFC
MENRRLTKEKVMDERKRLDMTQKELGEKVDLSTATIAGIENGNQAITYENELKLREALLLPHPKLLAVVEQVDEYNVKVTKD